MAKAKLAKSRIKEKREKKFKGVDLKIGISNSFKVLARCQVSPGYSGAQPHNKYANYQFNR